MNILNNYYYKNIILYFNSLINSEIILVTGTLSASALKLVTTLWRNTKVAAYFTSSISGLNLPSNAALAFAPNIKN